MKVWAFSIAWQEEKLLPLFLRHYETFCDKMVVWVEKGNDRTEEILKAHPKVWMLDWPHRGLNDEEFKNTFNWWPSKLGQEHNVDFCLVPDIDEILWHPNPKKAFQDPSADMFLSKGYALIDPNGFPKDDGRQIYDQVKSGVRQTNYDKPIIFRPGWHPDFSHGRHECHSYGGRIATKPTWKLYHLHHLFGTDHTRERNARNLERCIEKRYGWAYTDKQEKLATGGTTAWVESAIKNNQLFDVVEHDMSA